MSDEARAPLLFRPPTTIQPPRQGTQGGAGVEQRGEQQVANLPLPQRHIQEVAGDGRKDYSWVGESLMFLVIGMSGWWVANALIWAEIPILVQRTPEGKAISNVLNLAVQVGNLCPIGYKLAFSAETQSRILPHSILVSQVVAVAAAVAAAMLWQDDAHILSWGSHSVGLIACTVIAGAVGTLSNVTYWALCVRYPGTHCTKALSIGMTVSGLVQNLVATAVQGVGLKHPRFSFQVFMLACGTIQVLFALCFLFALKRPSAPVPLDDRPTSPTGNFTRTASKRSLQVGDSSTERSSVVKAPLLSEEKGDRAGSGGSDSSLEPLDREEVCGGGTAGAISHCEQNMILVVMFLIYCLTYGLPGLEPFMVDGYTANMTLPAPYVIGMMNLGAQIGDVSGRAGTLLPCVPGPLILWFMTLVVIGISGVLIATAVFWQDVPKALPGESAWYFPAMFLMYYTLRGYVVTALYVRVKVAMPRKQAEGFTANMGLCAQMGSLIGCFTVFVVVTVLRLFPTHTHWHIHW